MRSNKLPPSFAPIRTTTSAPRTGRMSRRSVSGRFRSARRGGADGLLGCHAGLRRPHDTRCAAGLEAELGGLRPRRAQGDAFDGVVGDELGAYALPVVLVVIAHCERHP